MTTQVSVFLLTSESSDEQGKNLLRFYGRSPEIGPVEILIQNSLPVFFIRHSQKLPYDFIHARRKTSSLKNVHGQTLDALYFSTYRDFRVGAEACRRNGISVYETDIRPDDRFLMEHFICAQVEVSGVSKLASGVTTFINPKLSPIQLDVSFKVLSIDIETSVSTRSLYSIALHGTGLGGEKSKVFMLSNEEKEEGEILYLKTEKALLEYFVGWIQKEDPDLIVGWNVVDFDLNFLFKRAKALGVRFAIGRHQREAFVKPRESGGFFAWIPGRVVIDGPMTLRSSFYSFEDFKLETVAQELLGTGKLIASDENKISKIDRLFREDKPALARYNLQDALLVSKIFEKTGLIKLLMRRSQISGLLMGQTGLSTAAFDHFFLPHFHRKGYAALDVIDIDYSQPATGGHVLDPIAGIHDHVLSFDFKSLYPSIMRTFKIDPLSRLCNQKNHIQTPNGFKFSRTEHVLPDFIRDLLLKRNEAKKNRDEPLSQAIKILMNSFYGVMGSAGCRFYHSDLPNAITGTGRWLLLESKKYLESQGYQVVYGDTDSLFVKIKFRGVQDPHQLGEDLAKEINVYWKKRIHQEFDTESFLEIEFEKYYLKYLLPHARGKEGGAKKRYAGLDLKDGNEVLEFIGMEFVRSDWTKLAKDFQHELYSKIFRGIPYQDWMKALVKDLKSGHLNDQLVYHKRLTKNAAEYTKSTPPHVKAARMLKTLPRAISYVMTRRGPVPIELPHSDIDYAHYIDKQLRPLADAALVFLGSSFDRVVGKSQMELF